MGDPDNSSLEGAKALKQSISLVDPLHHFLERLSLEKYHENLLSKEITLENLGDLTEEDLYSLGLSLAASKLIRRNATVADGESLHLVYRF